MADAAASGMPTQQDLSMAIELLRRQLDQEGAASVREAMAAMDPTDDHQDFVNWIGGLYPQYELFSRHGFIYPVVAFPSLPHQVSVDSVLGEDARPLAVDGCLLESSHSNFVLELTTAEGKPATDDPKFVMLSCATDGDIRIECARSTYFGVLDSCDVLKFEAQWAWRHHRDLIEAERAAGRTGLAVLPLRSRLHELVEDPVRDGSKRIAGIAVSTLICFSRGRTYRCLIQKRGLTGLAVDHKDFHVIPAAMFEPSIVSAAEPFSIHENVLREYAEECFKRKATEQSHPRPYWYHKYPEVKALKSILSEPDHGIHRLTGLAVNLLNLRPEVCTLLLIHDAGFVKWVDKMTINDEYRPDGHHVELIDGPTVASRYSDALAPKDVVPPGAVAFWLGAEAASQLIGYPPVIRFGDSGTTSAVHVKWFRDGEGQANTFPLSRARELATDADIAVDEASGVVRTPIFPEGIAICSASKPGMAMLCFCMANVDDNEVPRIEHTELRKGVGVKEHIGVQNYPSHLSNVVGVDLADRMLPKGGGRGGRRPAGTFPIGPTGWSFVWIRPLDHRGNPAATQLLDHDPTDQ